LPSGEFELEQDRYSSAMTVLLTKVLRCIGKTGRIGAPHRVSRTIVGGILAKPAEIFNLLVCWQSRQF